MQFGDDPMQLLDTEHRKSLASAQVVVTRTDYLGFNSGLFARAFGCLVEVHMPQNMKT